MKTLSYGLMDEEIFRELTTTVELDSTIPHIWSPRLEKIYLDILKLEQFAVVNNELLNKPGDEVEINRLNDIGPAVEMEGGTGRAGQALPDSETPWNNDTVVETAFTTEQIAILRPTIKFKAVRFTRKALVRSFVNVMGDATTALAYSLALKREMDCFNAISAGTQQEQSYTSWAALAGANVLTAGMVKNAKEIFDVAVKMNGMAYFPGDTCVMLIHPHQARDLTDDTDWFDVAKRNSAESIYRGELLEWDGVRFVKSTVVKFFAGGALTAVAVAADMATLNDIAAPQRRWYFSTDGTWANRQAYVVPRYQTSANPLTVTVDATDDNAKIVGINYREGWIEFDTEVGGTAAPEAVYDYGSVAGYEAILIGQRAFAIANKQMPLMARELKNYELFVGIGASVDYDVQRLNNEQIVKVWSAG